MRMHNVSAVTVAAAARRHAPELYCGRRTLHFLRSAPPHPVTVREYCPSTRRCTITAPPASETPGL